MAKKKTSLAEEVLNKRREAQADTLYSSPRSSSGSLASDILAERKKRQQEVEHNRLKQNLANRQNYLMEELGAMDMESLFNYNEFGMSDEKREEFSNIISNYRDKYTNLKNITRSISDDDYNTVMSSLDSLSDKFDILSSYESEDAFNQALKYQKDEEDMLSFDTEAGQKELDYLKDISDKVSAIENDVPSFKSEEEYYNAYKRMGCDDESARSLAADDIERANEILAKRQNDISVYLDEAGYGSSRELKDAIAEKEKYLKNAKRLQVAKDMEDAAKNLPEYGMSFDEDEDLNSAFTLKNKSFEEVSNYHYNKVYVSPSSKKKQDGFVGMPMIGSSSDINIDGSNLLYKAGTYMTDEEYAAYRAYVLNGDDASAERYIEALEYSLNERQASNYFTEVLKDNRAAEMIFGLESGLDQFSSGMRSLFNTKGDYIAPSATQMASQMVRQDVGGSGWGVAYDVATTTSNMLPSILASTVVGYVNPVAGSVVGSALMGSSAAGNAYQEMLNNGYNKDQARAYAIMTGISETCLQYAIGGVAKLGGKLTGNYLESFAKGLNSASARFAIEYGGDMLKEGMEEFLQDVLDPFFKQFATGEDLQLDENYWSDAIYSGLLGMLTAGILNGGEVVNSVSNKVAEVKTINQIREDGNIQNLIDFGKTFDATTSANKIANKVNENTSSLKLANLLHSVNATLSEQTTNAIRDELVSRGMRESDADTISQWLALATQGYELNKKQINILEKNRIVSGVFRDVVVNQNTTVNQRNNAMRSILGEEEFFNPELNDNAIKESVSNTSEALIGLKQYALEKSMRDMGIRSNFANEEKNSLFAKQSEFAKNSIAANRMDSVHKMAYSKVSAENGIEPTRIVSMDNGKMKLQTKDGSVVDSANTQYKSNDSAFVFEAMKEFKYPTDTANEFVDLIKMSRTDNVDNLLYGMNEAYNVGKAGYALEHYTGGGLINDLTEQQKKTAYNRGRIDASIEAGKKQTIRDNGKGKKIVNKGSVSKEDTSGMTETQKTSYEVAKKVVEDITHNKLEFYESVNVMGKQVFKNDVADFKAGQNAPNGWYDTKTGTIYIDLKAGSSGEGVILFTLAHELTHFISDWSPAKFKKLTDFLMQEYGKNNVPIETLINNQIASAKKNGRTISYDVALEEVVADSMQTMFTDTNLLEKLEKLKAQDKNLFQKIVDFIKDMYAKITKAYEGLDPYSSEAHYVKQMKDSLEKLSDLFAEGLVDAGETFSKTQIDDYLETKNILLHDRFVEPHMDMLSKSYDSKESTIELEEIEKRYQKIVDIWRTLGGELNSKFLYDWNNQEYKNRSFAVFKAQQGYKYNAELSTMCKKGIPLFEAIDHIVKKEIQKQLKTNVIGKAEKEILYDILKRKGFDIPCAICYVEQARQREGVIIDAFINGKVEKDSKGKTTKYKLGWNQVLDMVEERMSDKGVDYSFPNVSRDIATDTYQAASIDMDVDTQKAFYDSLVEICNEEIDRYNRDDKPKNPKKHIKSSNPNDVNDVLKGTLGGNLKIFKVLFNDKDSRFRIESDLLYSSMTTKNLANAHNNLYSLFNSQGGVSGYKTKQGTVVYLGDILKKSWTPAQTRKEGGIRNQSNSDFMMYTLLDQVQMYVDLTAKGYYLHAYTKVLAELKLFGLSGAKINASLIPSVHVYKNADGSINYDKTSKYAGLDEKGNPIYDDFEGVNHEEAFMLLDDPEYSKNISGICIGYSDLHIMRLLDEPRVQEIIGFHDKTDDPNKRYKGAKYSKNYNGLNEATKLKDDGTTETVHVGFNQFVIKAENMFKKDADGKLSGIAKHNGYSYSVDDIPRLATDLYKEYCAKKNYTPAYHIEVGTDADGNPIYMSDHPNYYKLMGDFGLKNSEGHYAPHRKVEFNMPDKIPYLDNGVKKYESTENYIKAELEKELKVRDDIANALADESSDGIIPQFVNEVNSLYGEDKKFSDRGEFIDSASGENVKFSLRKEEPPKRTIKGYKVFFVKDGKLYPPMVANPNGADTPIGVWLNADIGVQAPDSKTGRKQVKAGGKGTQGGSGSLAFRPGWHLGEIPLATQFDRLNPETGVKELFPENFVWAECDVAADIDYQEEAMSYGYNANGKFQHSLAGLPKIPTDGYYKYRTNPNPDTVPWLITGAMKVNRLLSDAEVNDILAENGIAPKKRQGGDKTLEDLGFIKNSDRNPLGEMTPTDRTERPISSKKEPANYALNSDRDSLGNTLSENQKKFFEKSLARDKNGNLKVYYHGTTSAGFTVFDNRFSDDKRSLFFTDKIENAQSYSASTDEFAPDKNYSFNELSRIIDTYSGGDTYIQKNDGVFSLYEVEMDDDELKISSSDISDIQRYFIDNYMNRGWDYSANIPVYLRLENPLIVDAHNNNWDEISSDIFRSAEDFSSIEFVKDNGDGMYLLELYPVDDSKYTKLYTEEQMLDTFGKYRTQRLMSGKGVGFTSVGSNGKHVPSSTRDYSEYAYNKGYDGVIFNNIIDNGLFGNKGIPSQVAIAFDSSRIKSIYNRNPTSREDIRYSDRDNRYMELAKNPEANEAELRKMVEQTARENGYDSPKLYHGTNQFGFTKIDTSLSDDKLSFFATDSENTAKSYSYDAKRRSINPKADGSNVDYEEEFNKVSDKFNDAMYSAIDAINRIAGVYNYLDYGESTKRIEEILSASQTTDGWADSIEDLVVFNWLYDAYDNAGMDVDEHEAEMDEFFDDYVAPLITIGNAKNEAAKAWNEGDTTNGLYELYANTDNMLTIDAQGKNWNNIRIYEFGGKFNEWYKKKHKGYSGDMILSTNTREIAGYASYYGYSGVIIKNVKDDGGRGTETVKPATVYIFFDPNEQIKSADTVTYDDNGNIIPLSERFNKDNNDIRYSERYTVNVGGIEVEYLGDVLDISQHKRFMSEIDTKPKSKFRRARNGDVIVPIDNMLVYTDFMKSDPGISKIIRFETDDYTLIDAATHTVYDKERYGWSYEQARRIVEGFIGEGNLTEYTNSSFGYDKEYDRQSKRGKIRSDSYHAEQQQKRRRFHFEAEEDGLNEESDKRVFSDRDLSFDSRTLLSNALATTAQNDIERKYIEDYQSKIATINEEQNRLTELRAELKELSFAPGKRDMNRINTLRDEATKIANKINTYDKQLLKLQASKPLEQVVERERLKAQRKAAERSREVLENYRNRVSTTSVRNKIKSLVSELSTRELNPKTNKYVPAGLMRQVADVLSAINIDSGRSEKLTTQLAELNAKYEAIKKSDKYSVAYDDVISEMLQALIADIGDTSIYDMSYAQLERTYTFLKALMHTIRESIKVHNIDTELNLFDISRKMREETDNVSSAGDGLGSLWLWKSLRPETAFAKLGGFAKDSMWSKVYDMLNRGQLKQMQIEMEANAIFNDVLSDKKYIQSLSEQMIDTGLTDTNGNPIIITKGMALAIYKSLQNEDNARHIMIGGFTVPNIKRYYKGDKGAYGIGRTEFKGIAGDLSEIDKQISDIKDRLAEETVEENYIHLESELRHLENDRERVLESGRGLVDGLEARLKDAITDEDMAFLNATTEFFDTYSREKLNEATMELYGFEKARVDNYFPIHTDADYRTASFESITKDMNLENSGFMKDRVKASNPIILEDIADVVNSQISMVARYCGMTLPVKDFGKIISKTEPGFTASLMSSIDAKFGKLGKSYIENLMSDIVGSRKGESTFLDRARGYMAGATLSLNPRVALAQSASLPTAASVLGWKAIGKSLGKFFTSHDLDLIKKYSPLLYNRSNGANIEVSDIKSMSQKKNRIMRKLNWLLGWIEAIDKRTVGTLWYASQYYVNDKFSNLEIGSDDYYKQVAEVFNDVVEQTQPNYSTLQRPDILRSPNALVKQLTMFMTQRLQNYNIVYESGARYKKYARDLKNGVNDVTKEDVQSARRGLVLALTSQATASVMIVGMKLLVDAIMHNMNAYRDDDEELNGKSISLQLLENLIDTTAGNLLGGSELFKLIDSKITGERYYGITLNGVEAYTNAIEEFSDVIGSKPSLSKFNELAKSLSVLMGIPLNNAEKIVQGMWLQIQDIKNGQFGSFEAGVERSKKQEVHRSYEAYTSGNMDKFDSIEVEQGSVTSYLKPIFLDAYKRNDTSTMATIRKYMKATNVYKDDIVKVTQAWIKNMNK